jgi:putative transposase
MNVAHLVLLQSVSRGPLSRFYLLRTGCQWRLLPREFPGWSTVYHYFQAWKNAGVWTCIQRSIYQQARRQAGRAACPSVVIMDGQSVKTTERGGIRGFDAHKRVKGRKRHILVDTFGLLIACRVEPADISDRKAAALLLGGLRPLFPNIRTVIADAGHQSAELARHLLRQDGWKLQIVKRLQRVQDHRPHMDCRAQLRLAWPQSTIKQVLRVLRAEL